MKIGDRIDSDYHPVEVWMKGREARKVGKSKLRKVWRGIWDEEGRDLFRRKLGTLEEFKGNLEEQWSRVKEGMRRTLKEVEEERRRKMEEKGQKEWWDEKCREKKRKVRRLMKEWRRNGTKEEEKREKRVCKVM